MSSKPQTNESLNIVATVVSFFDNLGTLEDRKRGLDGLYALRDMLSYEPTVTVEEREKGLRAGAAIREAISPDDTYDEEREKNLAYINDLNMNVRNWN